MQLPIAPGVCLTCNLFVLATVHKMKTFFLSLYSLQKFFCRPHFQAKEGKKIFSVTYEQSTFLTSLPAAFLQLFLSLF